MMIIDFNQRLKDPYIDYETCKQLVPYMSLFVIIEEHLYRHLGEILK